MTALVVAEHDNSRLSESTARAVAAAGQLAGEADILVAGEGCATVADGAARLAGVRRVLLAEAPHLRHGLAEPLAAAVAAVAPGYATLLAPATSSGREVMPRVAALLGVAQVSNVTGILSADTVEHPIYAGNAVETVRLLGAVRVLTIRPTGFAPVAAAASPAPVVRVTPAPDPGLSQWLSQSEPSAGRPDLGAARVVVAGGRGLGSAEAFARLLEPLARRLGAALGATRAAVDAGYAPNDWQVGQTGRIVAPELYLAVGISGAIQHLAGMKESRLIVAIDKDPAAPIFAVADYGLVGDLFALVPELQALL